MNLLLALVAGFIQGITEFLPVSSTAHLFIFEKFLNIPQTQFGLTFDASLHLGTLLAIVIFFKKEYLMSLVSHKKLFINILFGTIPAVVFGLIFENYIETTLRQVSLVAASLVLFSFIFILAELKGKKVSKVSDLSRLGAFSIGIFQALALIPGISRSGSTICAGLFLGLTRRESARFAFMLSGPIVAAAGLKKLQEAINTKGLTSSDFGFFVIGIISSFIFGYLTIKYFLRYLENRTLYPFVIYRIILGTILLLALAR